MLAAVLLAFATAMFQPVDAATTSQPVQVFVHDNSAQAQPGDGGHNWGLRPPTSNDPETAPLYNARGESLKSLLGIWRTADGSASFETAPQGATRVRMSFRGLVPNGRYSLFVRQRAVRMDPVFTPLDLVGTQNSFTADQQGNAEAAVVTPLQLPTGAQLVAFYHSDGIDHQSSLGNPGVNAHAQLILRVP
jgi:hypothetical protein